MKRRLFFNFTLCVLALLFGCRNSEKGDAVDVVNDSTALEIVNDSTAAEVVNHSASSKVLRIASWNLQWFPGKTSGGGSSAEESKHVNAVIDELKAIDADILLLQEIRDPDALEKILQSIPDYSLDVISNFEGNLEVAVLSRAPAKATAGFMQEFVRGDVADPPRGFAYATILLNDNSVLAVYSVHLKSNYGGIEETNPKRMESARQLVEHALSLKKHYEEEGKIFTAVIGGDFNSDPTDEKWQNDSTLNILTKSGFKWTGLNVSQEDRISWLSNGRYPDAVFDHILVLSGDGLKASGSITHKTSRDVSDHRAVIVDFGGTKKLSPPVHPVKIVKKTEASSGGEPEPQVGVEFWLNTNSNTRHNSNCRWFKKTKKGRACQAGEGKACGICGG